MSARRSSSPVHDLDPHAMAICRHETRTNVVRGSCIVESSRLRKRHRHVESLATPRPHKVGAERPELCSPSADVRLQGTSVSQLLLLL